MCNALWERNGIARLGARNAHVARAFSPSTATHVQSQMKNWGEVALGLVTGIGGFLEIGSIATTAQAGAEFGVQLAWVLLVGTVGLALEMATGIGLRWWALAVTFVGWLLLWRDGIGVNRVTAALGNFFGGGLAVMVLICAAMVLAPRHIKEGDRK